MLYNKFTTIKETKLSDRILLKTLRFSFSLFLILTNQFYIYNQTEGDSIELNEKGYFEKRGLNVLVFSNMYDGLFSDSKISGVEIIHHGIRTATNGDVRLNPTPGQWDPIPEFVSRNTSPEEKMIEVLLKYAAYEFKYCIKAEARDGGIYLSVILDTPLPEVLSGKAGFNLEFLPPAYFEKTFIMDETTGIFPLYPSGPMTINRSAKIDPLPFASGKELVFSPEDPASRITIQAQDCELHLYDGRNQAQNGWYVVRSLIPSDRTGKVIQWFLTANTWPGWIRQPVITHSQAGYHPAQEKIAVIELDKNDTAKRTACLFCVSDDGKASVVFKAGTEPWGNYLRYAYEKFDFSSIQKEGLYFIEYGDIRTRSFRIAKDVYKEAWYLSLDVFMPVQMDHMFVNEAYRVWHGASHLDDALQAPVNYEHFDLYAQGPSTDSPYKPGEHIPGLNVGGWYDAGDFDIRTQTQYASVQILVHAWESFGIRRDETTVDKTRKYVDIHVPDGIPDILQQIEHGTLALIAQHKAVGHAIPGIIAPDLPQYTHLGDASATTDNLVCNTPPKSFDWREFIACDCDDRWAFTCRSTPLNYGSIAALAAASRALRGYNDNLATECLAIAQKVWHDEHQHKPDIFYVGNTTGGPLELEEFKAAVELLITTKESVYAQRITELLPVIKRWFAWFAAPALLALPHMDASYQSEIRKLVPGYKHFTDSLNVKNPFGVPISTGGWGGNGQVVHNAITGYLLNQAFPDIIGPEYVFKGLHYIFGCHPGSDISFVSGVGTHSKKVAYGNNRADFTFIAGGVVPGVLIIQPDFPENKEDWPFLWGENEYVIELAASYIYLVNATIDLLSEIEQEEGKR
ncbi:MAG: glycoside hydrolase family 9 protein [Bacteroidales bacterium]|nr:glycoside hydrolase family 9 protein [Bacteroidales bacterium]